MFTTFVFLAAMLYYAFDGYSWCQRTASANARRKRVEKALRRERYMRQLERRNMALRHGKVLGELEKAHEELDEAEQRYRHLAAQLVDCLPAHEEKQILSLFQPPKENT